MYYFTSFIILCNSNKDDVHFLTIATNHNNAQYLLSSTKQVKIKIEFVKFNDRPFNMKNRLTCIKEYIQQFEDQDIILFTDAYDVFYLEPSDIIKKKFMEYNCSILISAEKWYSHQDPKYKKFYDKIGKKNNINILMLVLILVINTILTKCLNSY